MQESIMNNVNNQYKNRNSKLFHSWRASHKSRFIKKIHFIGVRNVLLRKTKPSLLLLALAVRSPSNKSAYKYKYLSSYLSSRGTCKKRGTCTSRATERVRATVRSPSNKSAYKSKICTCTSRATLALPLARRAWAWAWASAVRAVLVRHKSKRNVLLRKTTHHKSKRGSQSGALCTFQREVKQERDTKDSMDSTKGSMYSTRYNSLRGTSRVPKVHAKEKNFPSKNILQIINTLEKTIKKKQLIESSNNILLMISGGQDSIFLLFCLSFLQSQLSFKAKIIWCNHFWQICSFYTTLHLTKSSVAFSYSIIGFLPFGVSASLPSSWCCKQEKDLALAFLKTGRDRAYALNRLSYKSFCCVPLLGCKKSCAMFCYAKQKPSLLLRSIKSTICTCARTCNTICKKVSARQEPYEPYVHLMLRRSNEDDALQQIVDLYATHSVCTACKREVKYKTWYSTKKTKENWRQNSPSYYMGRILQKAQKKKKVKGYKQFVEAISETRARNWRHITTERASTFYNSDCCIYGHTASDRIETVLFNLIRGSRGSDALPWKRRHSSFCYNSFYPLLEQAINNTHISFI